MTDLELKALKDTASFDLPIPANVDPHLCAHRMPSLFWIWSPMMYHELVLPVIAGSQNTVYTVHYLESFIEDCREHFTSRLNHLSAESRRTIQHESSKGWLLTKADLVTWKQLHTQAWPTFFGNRKQANVDSAEVKRLFVSLACYTAFELCNYGQPEDEEFKKNGHNALCGEVFSYSDRLVVHVKNHWKYSGTITAESCQVAHYAATAWIECIWEIVESIKQWIGEPKVKVKQEKKQRTSTKRKHREEIENVYWLPQDTPCYEGRSRLSRDDPFTHGFPLRKVPIQLVMMIDPQDGGIARNKVELGYPIRLLKNQVVPARPYNASHSCYASYTLEKEEEEEAGVLCTTIQSDESERLIQVLIPENAGRNRCKKALESWGAMESCQLDVTKGVDLKSDHQSGTKREDPGKGNTKAGGKTHISNDLSTQVKATFDAWWNALIPGAHDSVVRLIFHPTSSQQAFMFVLYFAFRYVIENTISALADNPYDRDLIEIKKSLVGTDKWQVELQHSLREDFRDMLQMYSIALYSTSSELKPSNHCLGCPFAFYSDALNERMQQLVPVILESATGYKYDPTNIPDLWWPNLMVKKPVCRSWADELNKYRLNRLDIQKGDADRVHKLTGCLMMATTSENSCLCDWRKQRAFNQPSDRDEWMSRTAKTYVNHESLDRNAFFHWVYFQMRPKEWSHHAVKKRLESETTASPTEGITNLFAYCTFRLYCSAIPDLYSEWLDWKEAFTSMLTSEWLDHRKTNNPMPVVEWMTCVKDDEDEDDDNDPVKQEPDDDGVSADDSGVFDSEEEETTPKQTKKQKVDTNRVKRPLLIPITSEMDDIAEAEMLNLCKELEAMASCPSLVLLNAVSDMVHRRNRLPWQDWREFLTNTIELCRHFANSSEAARKLHFRLMGFNYQE